LKKPKFIKEKKAETKSLEQLLSATNINDIVTYKTMSALIGFSVQSERGRGYLYTAIKTMQREQRMVFVTVKNVGVQRANDVAIVATGRSYTKHIGRTARKASKKQDLADFRNLPAEARSEATVRSAQFKLLAHFSNENKAKSAKKKTTTPMPPVSMTLKASLAAMKGDL
jgi:hypothetical protein